MNLSTLPKTTIPKAKRRGRGYGSGRGGHTSGRGAKGNKARGKVGLLFMGTKTKKSLVKRLPLRRGKGKFKAQTGKPIVVNLKYLSLYTKNETVDLDSLVKKGIVDRQDAIKYGVKVLGGGELKVPLTVSLPRSKSAAQKITKAGGSLK